MNLSKNNTEKQKLELAFQQIQRHKKKSINLKFKIDTYII